MSTRASHGKIAGNVLEGMFKKAHLDSDQTQGRYANTRQLPEPPKIPVWDQLLVSAHLCQQGLLVYNGLVGLKSRIDIFEAMTTDERTLYEIKMQQFCRDLQSYMHDLATIQALHAGKTGYETDPNEVCRSIQIYEQYENFKVQSESVLGQSYLFITELVQNVEKRMADMAPLNPTTITDVVIHQETDDAPNI